MNETIETIRSIRTVHGDFSDRSIPEEQVQTIVDCAIRAANASGRQSYSIIEVSDRDRMQELCGYQGDRLLVFCVDFTRIIDVAEWLGHEYSISDVVSFVTGSTDTILAAQTACIAAKSLGIDSLFTNGIHRGDMARVWDILALPEANCFPLIALVLGYSRTEPAFLKGRLSGAGVIHHETYRRLSEDELESIISEYDDPERHLSLGVDWAEQGMKHYLDWFYTKWSRRADTAPFCELLRKTGFLPGAR